MEFMGKSPDSAGVTGAPTLFVRWVNQSLNLYCASHRSSNAIKCWHVQAFKEDRVRRSIVESDRRPSERTSADPFDSAWAWWYWQ